MNGQEAILVGHCPLTGRYIEPCAGSIPTVIRLTFQPARCGYTLRVTSKTLYSPEYTTPKHTQKILVSASLKYHHSPHSPKLGILSRLACSSWRTFQSLQSQIPRQLSLMRHRVVLVGPFYNTTPNQVHLNNGWNIITRDHLGISGTTVVSACVLR